MLLEGGQGSRVWGFWIEAEGLGFVIRALNPNSPAHLQA